MPELDTTLHLDMLHKFRAEKIPLWKAAERGYATWRTLDRAVAQGKLSVELDKNGARLLEVSDLLRVYGKPSAAADIYGMNWGNPDTMEPLRFIRTRYLLPLLSPEMVAVEIGPGGGRWTRYLRA